jgi:hypothetical protein
VPEGKVLARLPVFNYAQLLSSPLTLLSLSLIKRSAIYVLANAVKSKSEKHISKPNKGRRTRFRGVRGASGTEEGCRVCQRSRL